MCHIYFYFKEDLLETIKIYKDPTTIIFTSSVCWTKGSFNFTHKTLGKKKPFIFIYILYINTFQIFSSNVDFSNIKNT